MNSLKKLQIYPLAVAAVSFLLGLGAYWSYETYQAKQWDSFVSLFFPLEPEDFFFGSEDALTESFHQLETLQTELVKGLPSATWAGNTSDLHVREDESFVHYEIAIPDLQEKSVQVFLDDSELTIRGEAEKRTEKGWFGHRGEAFFSSVFSRTFPLPQNTDPNKAKIEYQKDKVIVKFPKIPSDSLEVPVQQDSSFSV